MSKDTEPLKNLSESYWNQRYLDEETGWDIGDASTPLITYTEKIQDRSCKVLIPGAGRAWEFDKLQKQGFKNVFILDWAEEALEAIRKRHPDIGGEGSFDLVLEQTFFCALPPSQRPEYVKQMHQILKPGGYLVGVMFQFPLSAEGPPFGGSKEEYQRLFSPLFDIEIMETCYNSIPPRAGRELFVKMRRKDD
jgi:thiopurine S-methyltransferase